MDARTCAEPEIDASGFFDIDEKTGLIDERFDAELSRLIDTYFTYEPDDVKKILRSYILSRSLGMGSWFGAEPSGRRHRWRPVFPSSPYTVPSSSTMTTRPGFTALTMRLTEKIQSYG
mgnify:CR=1 FL=1